MPRTLTLLLLTAVALALVPATDALAAPKAPRKFTTSIIAKDDTDFTRRSGTKGDRCSTWSNIEGHAVTTIDHGGDGAMVIYPDGVRYPGSRKRVPLLSHGLLRGDVRSKLTIAARKHFGVPCGCGPNSELGTCPPEVPDKVMNDTCNRTKGAGATLGVTAVKRKLNLLAGAGVESLMEDCRYGGRNFVPVDYGLPGDVALPASAMGRFLALEVGQETEIRDSFKHAGKELGCPRGTTTQPVSVCGVFTYTLTVRRTA